MARTWIVCFQISWNLNDYFVVTAGTDCLLRVWNSHTASMVHALKGHADEVYVLEAHPTQPHLLLSAGMFLLVCCENVLVGGVR